MSRRATPLSTSLAAVMALTAGLALAGCSSGSEGPELTVSGAFMPQPVGDMAGGFLTVSNKGDAADKLTSVTSPLSDDVQIHETKDQKMRQVTSFDIPAHGELALERGGNHIMFMEIKQQPKVGQQVTVELHFEKADPITVELPVKDRTYNPQHH